MGARQRQSINSLATERDAPCRWSRARWSDRRPRRPWCGTSPAQIKHRETRCSVEIHDVVSGSPRRCSQRAMDAARRSCSRSRLQERCEALAQAAAVDRRTRALILVWHEQTDGRAQREASLSEPAVGGCHREARPAGRCGSAHLGARHDGGRRRSSCFCGAGAVGALAAPSHTRRHAPGHPPRPEPGAAARHRRCSPHLATRESRRVRADLMTHLCSAIRRTSSRGTCDQTCSYSALI